MKITTNYSKKDWQLFLASLTVHCIPLIVLLYGVFGYFLPHIDFFLIWTNYLVDNQILADFRDWYYTENHDNELVYYFFWGWLGFSIMPIVAFHILYKLIPTTWICKKLKIEPRMKLVIFRNGKPIRWSKKR